MFPFYDDINIINWSFCG